MAGLHFIIYAFLQAMHLVYRALEKDPVPTTLPPSLIPPSKRKKEAMLAGAVPLPGLAGDISLGPGVSFVNIT